MQQNLTHVCLMKSVAQVTLDYFDPIHYIKK